MFSISHPSEETFRLEIHGSPSDLDPENARRLRAVLLGLAEQVRTGGEAEASTEDPPPLRRPGIVRDREAAG